MRIVIGRYETGEPFRGGDNTGSPRAKGSAICEFYGPLKVARNPSSPLGAALNLLQETCRHLSQGFFQLSRPFLVVRRYENQSSDGVVGNVRKVEGEIRNV